MAHRFTFQASNTDNVMGNNCYINDAGSSSKRLAEGNAARIKFTADGDIFFQTAGSDQAETDITWTDGIRIKNDGKIGIGAFSTSTWDGADYKLYVKGGIRTESIKVDLSTNGWADYVFDENYPLLSITELAKFIKDNKHLPGIPTEEEVKRDGVDLLEMQIKLLQKIEELSIYITRMDKRIDELK